MGKYIVVLSCNLSMCLHDDCHIVTGVCVLYKYKDVFMDISDFPILLFISYSIADIF